MCVYVHVPMNEVAGMDWPERNIDTTRKKHEDQSSSRSDAHELNFWSSKFKIQIDSQ